MSLTGTDLSLNETAFLDQDDNLNEIKVFNITLLSLALCILTITGIITCILYHNHRRKPNRACVYESGVACEVVEEPVGVTCVRKTCGFQNTLALFSSQEGPKDNSQIFFIYSTPLPVGHEEDNTPPQTLSTHTLITLQDYANDPKSGITLDPSIFFMQL